MWVKIKDLNSPVQDNFALASHNRWIEEAETNSNGNITLFKEWWRGI